MSPETSTFLEFWIFVSDIITLTIALCFGHLFSGLQSIKEENNLSRRLLYLVGEYL